MQGFTFGSVGPIRVYGKTSNPDEKKYDDLLKKELGDDYLTKESWKKRNVPGDAKFSLDRAYILDGAHR